MDGVRRPPPSGELPPAISADQRASLEEPPAHLSDAAKACWREWAPRALAPDVRTLVPSTELGFEELCLRMANVKALDKKIQQLEIASQEALPYLRERRGQSAQLAASMKDFKLTAFGKPATAEKPRAKDSGWGAFGSPTAAGK